MFQLLPAAVTKEEADAIVDDAEVSELTDLLGSGVLAGFPSGTRLICRRERPHPGAELSLLDQVNRDAAPGVRR